MTDLTGKIVLITGATDGLGRGVAISLAQRGATLPCMDETAPAVKPSSGRSGP